VRTLARQLLPIAVMARTTMSRVAWLGGLGLLAAELLATAAWLPAKASADRPPVQRRAADHGANLTALQRSIVMLDYHTAARLGSQVARDEVPVANGPQSASRPRVQRVRLQGELRARAIQLAEAARTGDDAAVASAAGSLQETCVRCHRLYMSEGASEGVTDVQQ
jgi:hypothetical protein